MPWNKAEEMFPEGKISCELGELTIEEIRNNNFSYIESYIITPVREMIETQEKIIYYENGNMDRIYTYSIQPYELIDGKPLLNVYGQKMLNDYLQRKKGEN